MSFNHPAEETNTEYDARKADVQVYQVLKEQIHDDEKEHKQDLEFRQPHEPKHTIDCPRQQRRLRQTLFPLHRASVLLPFC